MDRMTGWISTGERPLPHFVTPFAKSASGGGKGSEDDDADEDDDEDDDEEDDDDLADLSEDELREELKKTRRSLQGTNASDAKKRAKIKRLNAELEEAKKPKPKGKKADDGEDDGPDLDTIRHEARSEGEKAGLLRAKKAEAKSSLLAAGVNPARVAKAVGLLDLDELDLDDDGLDGIDDEIEDLRKEWPELFAKKRQRRQSVAGDRDEERDEGKSRRKGKSASEQAAAQLLGRS